MPSVVIKKINQKELKVSQRSFINMEKQNIEYKRQWNDEYLKGICGFANAGGSKIYINIDDEGLCEAI